MTESKKAYLLELTPFLRPIFIKFIVVINDDNVGRPNLRRGAIRVRFHFAPVKRFTLPKLETGFFRFYDTRAKYRVSKSKFLPW